MILSWHIGASKSELVKPMEETKLFKEIEIGATINEDSAEMETSHAEGAKRESSTSEYIEEDSQHSQTSATEEQNTSGVAKQSEENIVTISKLVKEMPETTKDDSLILETSIANATNKNEVKLIKENILNNPIVANESADLQPEDEANKSKIEIKVKEKNSELSDSGANKPSKIVTTMLTEEASNNEEAKTIDEIILKNVNKMCEALKDDSLDLESQHSDKLSESEEANPKEEHILNKTILSPIYEPIKDNTLDLELSHSKQADRSEEAESNKDILNKANIATTIIESTKDFFPDSESAFTKETNKTKTTEPNEIIFNETVKIVTAISDAAKDDSFEGAHESEAIILNKAVKNAETVKETPKDDTLGLKETATAETVESTVVTRSKGKIQNSMMINDADECEVVKPVEIIILKKAVKSSERMSYTKKADPLALGKFPEDETRENAEKSISKRAVKILSIPSKTTIEISRLEGIRKDRVAASKVLTSQKITHTAKAMESNTTSVIGKKVNINLTNVPIKRNITLVNDSKEAKRARTNSSPPRKLYAVLKPPKEDTFTDPSNSHAPIHSPEGVTKHIQSQFPTSISVSVKQSNEADDNVNVNNCSANIAINPKASVSLENDFQSVSQTSVKSSSIGTSIASKPTATTDPPSDVTSTQPATSESCPTIKRDAKFAVRCPTSIATNAIRKSKLLFPTKNVSAQICDKKALVTSIKFLPRCTLPITALTNENQCKEPPPVPVPRSNQEKLPLPAQTITKKQNVPNSTGVPTFTHSYLKSLSAYIREAKAYHANASEASAADCAKDDRTASVQKAVDLEDIETDLVAYEIFESGMNVIDNNLNAGSRNVCTQTDEGVIGILNKIALLKDKVKLQAEEIGSLKAAMKFLNAKLDIANV